MDQESEATVEGGLEQTYFTLFGKVVSSFIGFRDPMYYKV
jgi:hypothetical protein